MSLLGRMLQRIFQNDQIKENISVAGTDFVIIDLFLSI